MTTRAAEPAGYLTVSQPTQCVNTVLWRGEAAPPFGPPASRAAAGAPDGRGRSPRTPAPVPSWRAAHRRGSRPRQAGGGRSQRWRGALACCSFRTTLRPAPPAPGRAPALAAPATGYGEGAPGGAA